VRPNRAYRLSIFQAAHFCIRILPRPISQWIAAGIGRAAYWLNPQARAALRENLARVTGASGRLLDRVCLRNFTNFLQMLADYLYAAGAEREKITSLMGNSRGLEHFHAARALGKGVLVVTGHLGNWELGGVLLALHDLPVTVVTLEEPSSELTRWRDAYRRRLGIKTITVGNDPFAFVAMVQALKNNECLAMLIDRPYGGSGTPVDFFGQRTCFSTAPALLWQHTGAAVVPAFVVRENGRYVSFAEAPVQLAPADRRAGLEENTQRLATAFEETIRRYPDQWYNYVPIWTHHS
jgi:lauroyl/myristoyl acyltransferase